MNKCLEEEKVFSLKFEEKNFRVRRRKDNGREGGREREKER